MRNSKVLINLVLTIVFTLFIIDGISTEVIAKPQTSKSQITIATNAVVKVEKLAGAMNFNPASAQKQLTLAIKEVAKIKALGKKYLQDYNSLTKRIDLVKKKISEKTQSALYINEGIGHLSVDKTESINIEDDKYTSPKAMEEIFSFLNNIKSDPIKDERKALALAPAGGSVLNIIINYNDKSKIKKENVVLFVSNYMIDSTYDKANKLVFRKYYVPEAYLLYKMNNLREEIDKEKTFKLNLDVTNINADKIDSISLINFGCMERTIKDEASIESVANIINSLNISQTSEIIENIVAKRISITFKDGNEIKRTSFNFTDKLMEYKAYDINGTLLTVNHYEVKGNILRAIDDIILNRK